MSVDPAQIANISIFRDLPPETLAEIAGALEEEIVPADSPIFEENAPGDALYILLDGQIRVDKIIDPTAGTRKTIAILEPGAFVGELALLDARPRSAGVRAHTDARVLRLTKETFDGLLRENAFVAARLLFGIILEISARMRTTNADLVTLFETGRVAGLAAPLREILDQILARLMGNTGATVGLVALYNSALDVIQIGADRGYAEGDFGRLVLRPGDGILGRLHSTRETIKIDEFDHSDDHGYECPAMIGAPLIMDAGPVGAVLLGHQTPGYFTANHLNLLTGVAVQTAAAIAAARRREEDEGRSRLGRQYVQF